MKKLQLTDALRNIKKERVSYLSILLIAFMAVTCYLGVVSAKTALLRAGNRFYEDSSFRDLEIVATLLLEPEDVDAIRAVEGVADVEGVYQTKAKVENAGAKLEVAVQTMTERINRPALVSGRLPAAANECAVEQRLSDGTDYAVGGTIRLTDGAEGAPKYLAGSEYVITGVFLHPDHICDAIQGAPAVLVTEDAFLTGELENCFMKAEVLFEKPAGTDRYSEAYLASVEAVRKALDDLSLDRAVLRDAAVHERYEEELALNRQKLEETARQLEEARAQLDSGKALLEEKEAELAAARDTLDASAKELEDGKALLESSAEQLADAETKLSAAVQELDRAKEQLTDGRKTINDAREKLAETGRQIEDKKQQLRDGISSGLLQALVYAGGVAEEKAAAAVASIPWAQRGSMNVDDANLDARWFQLADGIGLRLPDTYEEACTAVMGKFDPLFDMVLSSLRAQGVETELLEGNRETVRGAMVTTLRGASALAGGYADHIAQLDSWNAGHKEYLDGKAKLDAAQREYDKSRAEYDRNREAYEAGVAEYERGTREYEDGLAAYEEGKAQYEAGAAEYERGVASYEEGLAELQEGEAKYNEGALKLEEARSALDELDPARWILLDAEANGGYMQLRTSADSAGTIGSRFTLLFLVIAALVIYATVGKLVDEQHKLVGTTKAFGFFNREILAKYLLYGVSATALGVVLGALASLALQTYVVAGFSKIFVFGQPANAVRADLTALVLGLGVLLSAAAVWAAGKNLMRSTAIELMKDSAPAGVRKGAGGKSVLTLYQRLILRNMRSDGKRIFITVVSVMGCCALMVVGFTMRAGFVKTPERQFGQIVRYDFDLSFEPDKTGETQRAIESVLQSRGAEAAPAYRLYTSVDVNGERGFAELVVMDAAQLESLFRLDSAETGQPLSIGGEGVYLLSGFRDTYGVSTGGSVVLTDASGTRARAQIAGIYRNYAGQLVFMTPEYYERLFGAAPKANYLMGRWNGTNSDELNEALRAVNGFNSLERSDTLRTLFDRFSLVILALAGLLTFAAGLMAAVILTNLTNICIRQKTRELAVMRVNGFTVRETIQYVLRETYLTTALGVVLGCVVGSALGIWLIRSFQSPFFRFVAEVDAPACLIAAGITVIFAAVINAVSLRKVKDLKLTDAVS